MVSDLLSAFLPFATVPLVNQLDVEEDEDPVPSHNPLELKDPLPCLQLFTPLNFSSTLDLPQYKGEFQNQLHHLRIQGAESLFHADVDIRVTSLASNPTKPHVSYLSVPSISHWAQPELQQWMGSRCKARDVRTLLYSFGSYWDIAVRRAQCWARCEKAFAPLLDDRGEAEKENMEQNDSDGKFSEVQLLPHLGRTSLLFRNDDVALRISWRLKFDWTGEAESDVSASAAFAPLCKLCAVY